MGQIKKIAIIGAGGLGREIYCVIKLINDLDHTWDFIGFFDDNMLKGSQNEYGEILGSIDDINKWDEHLDVVVAIGNGSVVRKITESITNPNIHYPNIIAPNVIFFDKKHISLGQGNIIGYGSMVSCNVSFGDFNLINGACLFGHDTTVGSYNTIMPSTNISGNVAIGNENFMGVKTTILQSVKIGNKTRVGANSVIIRNTKDDTLYIGNPATKFKM